MKTHSLVKTEWQEPFCITK